MSERSWAILYDGMEVFTDADGAWDDAPHRGVLAIVQADAEVGRAVTWNNDFYWWFPGQDGPSGGDVFGLYDYLEEVGSIYASKMLPDNVLARLAGEGVKFGRSVDKRVMREALKLATELEGFEAKSAYLPSETIPPPDLIPE